MIRLFKSEDLEETLRLYTAMYSYHRELFGGTPLKPDDLRDEFKKVTRSRKNTIFVFEQDNRIVGFARLFNDEGCFFLKELYVVPETRNKGIGTKLLKACEEFARKHESPNIYLNVVPANELAINFYLKNGYDLINTIELTKTNKKENIERIEFVGKKFHVRISTKST